MKKPFKEIPATPLHIKATIWSLLANLMGDENRSSELERAIEVNDIPEDLPFEKAVLDKIIWHWDHQHHPTSANVLMALKLAYPDNDPTTLFDQVMAAQTVDGDVSLAARIFWDWKLQERVHEKWEESLTILKTPIGSIQERVEKALAVVTGLTPDVSETPAMDDLQRFEDWKLRQAERFRKAQEGIPLGPQIPVIGIMGGERVKMGTGEIIPVEGKIPSFMMRELTLISGLPGIGKSILAWVIAEHNAWNLGYDVLMLHGETGTDVLEMRQIARNCGIPFRAQSTGYLNPDDPRIQNKLQQFRERVANAPGKLYNIFSVEWDVNKIRSAIRLFNMQAQRAGKQLIVVIDYLQNIARDGYANEALALTSICESLKNCANLEDTHIFLFAQETVGENGNKEAYGSKGAKQKAQNYISIECEDAAPAQDFPVKVWDPNARELVFAKDALGGGRFYHRKGDKNSAMGTLMIHKCNNGQTGPVSVLFERAFFRLHEPLNN